MRKTARASSSSPSWVTAEISEHPVARECRDQAGRRSGGALAVQLGAHDEARAGRRAPPRTSGELRLEHPHGVGSALVAKVHEEQQHRAPLHVPEEAQAEAAARGRPFDDARDVRDTTFPLPFCAAAQVGRARGEGILGNLGIGIGEHRQERRLPRIGLPDQPASAMIWSSTRSSRARPGTPFCANAAPGDGGAVVPVALAALAPFRRTKRSPASERSASSACEAASRTTYREAPPPRRAAVPAVLPLPGPVPAVLGPEAMPHLEVRQRAQVGGPRDDVAARPPSPPSGRPGERIFPVGGNCPVTPAAGGDDDGGLVTKPSTTAVSRKSAAP